jgi:hypothetical protein
VLNALLTRGLKEVAHRERPNRVNNLSFLSHASDTFTAATVLAHFHGIEAGRCGRRERRSDLVLAPGDRRPSLERRDGGATLAVLPLWQLPSPEKTPPARAIPRSSPPAVACRSAALK